ncbi:BUB protein kinase [Aphanomyces astaci]|uniref:BUB protein kinase n=1 Tax=Aphanomyces astaci TaxID=112090 RepID=W4FFT6_APHAT|nr:BUB protein kinase [Aphanomyces astaci]ETV65734.1 BUB protein kinase [Aphanomyces astaci]|eukprot:XP_009844786.1 BUB protein kinase [Aphanomyces astaci]
MSDLVFVHDTTFDAHLPMGGKRGAKWKPQAVIHLCRASSCKLTGHLGSGSYASVYAAQLFESDASKTPVELAVKHETRVGYLPWECYCISEINARQNTTNEHGSSVVDRRIVQVYALHVFKNSTLLFLQRGDKGTLHGLVNLYAQFGRRMPEPVVVHYACQMLDAVQRVHGANFVHGDIKPDNWIVVDGRSPWNHATTFATGAVCLIDFGRAIDLQLYPPDTAFCGDCHASGFQCVEMLTKTQWTHQIDTFGLCATIHLLLFGEYMECVKMDDKWTITRRWKRYWHVELWQDLFDSFLNVPSCAHQPNLCDWRLKLHKYFTEANQKKLNHQLCAQDKMFH